MKVFRLKIRICGQDFGLRHRVGNHSNHRGDRDSKAAYARDAAHLSRADCNPGVSHLRFRGTLDRSESVRMTRPSNETTLSRCCGEVNGIARGIHIPTKCTVRSLLANIGNL